MTYITKNFTVEEFEKSDIAAKNEINNRINDVEVLSNITYLCMHLLQPLRDAINMPITITSGYRCYKLNKAVNGAKTSQHMKGEAADIICNDLNKIYLFVKNSGIDFDQMIVYTKKKFIHLSLKKDGNRKQILYNNN